MIKILKTIKYITVICLLGVFTSCSLLESLPKTTGEKPEKKLLRARFIKNLDPDYVSGNLPIALHGPLVYREMVFVGSNDGKMNAFSKEDGRLIWSTKENGAYHAMATPFKNSIVYGNVSGRLFRRNLRTGKLVYSVDLDSAVESSPVIYRGRMFVHARNHKVFCLDVETGKILWAYKRSVPFLTTLQRVSRPLIYKGKLYVGFADGSVVSLSVEEGVILWESKISQANKFVDVDSSPIIFREKLIVTSLSDSVTVLNPRSGQIERKIPYSVSRAPYVMGNNLVMGTADGELIFLDKNLNILRKASVAKDSISNIMSWGRDLMVTTVDGHVLIVNPMSLDVLEKKFLGHASSAVFGKLSREGDSVALLSSRNRLYLFSL